MVLIVNANYHGTLQNAKMILEPFASLGPLRSEHIVVPWPRVFETSYFGIDDAKACSRNQLVNMYSIAAVHTDAKAMATYLGELRDFSRLNTDIASTFVIHRFPSPPERAGSGDDSAYPYRDLKMHM